MNEKVIPSPTDASTGVQSVLTDGAGCVEPASSDSAAVQPQASPEAEKPTTVREFERAMRGLGFSRSEAAAIARGGFQAIKNADSTDEFDELAALLKSNVAILKG